MERRQERCTAASKNPRAKAEGSRVHRHLFDASVLQAAENLQEASDVHGLGQAILDRLTDDGLSSGSRSGLPANFPGRRAPGKAPHRRSWPAAQERRRDSLSAARRSRQRALCVPAHRVSKSGVARTAWRGFPGGRWIQVVEHLFERETVMSPRRGQWIPLGGSLQLEPEPDAEFLRRASPQARLTWSRTARERRAASPASLSKKTLQDHAALGSERRRSSPPPATTYPQPGPRRRPQPVPAAFAERRRPPPSGVCRAPPRAWPRSQPTARRCGPPSPTVTELGGCPFASGHRTFRARRENRQTCCRAGRCPRRWTRWPSPR